MKRADADAIAQFEQRGGKVRKVAAAVPASEQEVLAYLVEGCGLTLKYFPGDLKPYACRSRRYSIDGLVRLANTYRIGQQLPPLMLGRHNFGSASVRNEPHNPV